MSVGQKKIPDDQLTLEQKKRRERNERYRRRSVSNKSRLQLVSQDSEETDATTISSHAVSNPSRSSPSQKKSAVSNGGDRDCESKKKRAVSNKEHLSTSSQTERFVSKNKIEDNKKPLFILSPTTVVTVPLLVISCVLSYFLQIEVYESLDILPDIQIGGLSIVPLTAFLVEAL